LFINLTPLKHPEKSSIFLGTCFVPLSVIGRCILSMRGRNKKEGDGVNPSLGRMEKRSMIICVTNLSELAQGGKATGGGWRLCSLAAIMDSILFFTSAEASPVTR